MLHHLLVSNASVLLYGWSGALCLASRLDFFKTGTQLDPMYKYAVHTFTNILQKKSV